MSLPFDPFDEWAQIQRTECRNGLSYNDLGQSACNVFQLSKCDNAVQLQEADLEPWAGVAAKSAQIVDIPDTEQAVVEVSAKGLAKTLYTQYHLSKDGVPHWDEQTDKDKMAWEAVGRHLANLISSDGQSLDLKDLEERMALWAWEREPALTSE